MRRLRVTQRAIERAMFRVYLRDQIRNVEIRRSTRVTDIAQRVRRNDGRWGPKAGMSAPHWKAQRWSTPKMDRRLDAGSNRHKTVEFGTPYNGPMSSDGSISVDMTMMMNYVQLLQTILSFVCVYYGSFLNILWERLYE
ncbi:jg16934 [Pararge aegeria aegeria]|uniref:Jg16934 protein n=1 Tax=Pararge aegeria aegeria TaxID=348720 RepID=A0A8S4QLV9_9NEOP|nr:jg16934 [Pararge aegeria aegeria]